METVCGGGLTLPVKEAQRERKARGSVPKVHDTTATSFWGRGKLGLLGTLLNPISGDNAATVVGLSEVPMDRLAS